MKPCHLLKHTLNIDDACVEATAIADRDGLTVVFWHNEVMVVVNPGDSFETAQANANAARTCQPWERTGVIGEIRLRQTSIIVRAIMGWRFEVQANGKLLGETFETADKAKKAAGRLCISMIEMGIAP